VLDPENAMPCLFCRIAAGEVPARVAYEDEFVMAFHDRDPKAPVHLLIIPKTHVANVAAVADEHAGVLGRALVVARQLAEEAGIAESGYRLVVNTHADAGQSVDHLHFHLLGGRRLGWPPG
jgi:histidine triad (HIT) family protein